MCRCQTIKNLILTTSAIFFGKISVFPNSNTSISARSCSCRSPAIGLLTYRCILAFGFKVIRLQLTFYTRLQKTNLLENCNYFATAKEQFRSSTNLGKKNIILEISLWTIYSLEVSCIKSKVFIFLPTMVKFRIAGNPSFRFYTRHFSAWMHLKKKNRKKIRSFQTGEKIFNGKSSFTGFTSFSHFWLKALIEIGLKPYFETRLAVAKDCNDYFFRILHHWKKHLVPVTSCNIIFRLMEQNWIPLKANGWLRM